MDDIINFISIYDLWFLKENIIKHNKGGSMQDILEKRKVLEVEVDETLVKQLRFIGLLQQIGGVLGIIGGAFMCLTIIGAAAGVPYIMGSINIFKSGGSMSDTAINESGTSLREAIGSLAKGMKLLLIGLVIWIILYIIFIFVMMMIGVMAASQGY